MSNHRSQNKTKFQNYNKKYYFQRNNFIIYLNSLTMIDENSKKDVAFPLYSACEKKRAFDKTNFLEELPYFIKKPFPISFYMNLLEIEEKLLKNSRSVDLMDKAFDSYNVKKHLFKK